MREGKGAAIRPRQVWRSNQLGRFKLMFNCRDGGERRRLFEKTGRPTGGDPALEPDYFSSDQRKQPLFGKSGARNFF
jgi:hypothetical protein